MAEAPKQSGDGGAPQPQGGDGLSPEIVANLRLQRNFEHMPEEMLRKLLRVMTVAHYEYGALIMEQGKEFPNTCILLKGRVAIFVDNKHILDLRRTGDILGEMSFINEGPCSATVKAESACDLILISKATLTEIGDTNFYIWLCRVLSDKLKRTSEMLSKES
jgi:CRP-like cAMP-binding protein